MKDVLVSRQGHDQRKANFQVTVNLSSINPKIGLKRSAVAAVILGLFILTAIYVVHTLFLPVAESGTVEVYVPSGTGYRQALRLFREKGLIRSELPMIALGRLTGVEKSLQPGLYRIQEGSSPLDVFNKIRNGDTETLALTIPEGYSVEQIAMAVETAGIAPSDEFLRAARDEKLAAELDIPARSFEGFLFPDTYNVPFGTTADELIKIMVAGFRTAFRPELEQRLQETGMTLLEMVTLASIVEKETGKDFERPLIAAVFLNRLKKGMRLESDPTILYGVRPLGEPIRRSEIKRRTPYNTYVIKGLPPGPIANPGLASMEAVLYPEDADYLYFVAQKDGTHKFSTSLSDHNRAVRQYRRGG